MQTLTSVHDPTVALERVEALRILDRLLAQLDDDKREVFVLAEVEQMSVAEIAEILEANINTVASRLRAARQEFEKALLRFQAREQRRES
jgi:RNA polymerase sigma-70 factor (ECF subfamily)